MDGSLNGTLWEMRKGGRGVFGGGDLCEGWG